MRRIIQINTIAALVLCTGAAFGQADVNRGQGERIGAVQPGKPSMTMSCHNGSNLLGLDVANPNNEVVASVSDFIVERGSGRLEYVILKSGDVLGIGGKSIAVPYGKLGYDPVKKRFTLDMTKEQIERAVEFLPENWSELQSNTWVDALDKWWYGETEDQIDENRRVEELRKGKRETIEGTVTAVDRVRTGDREERILVDVKTEGGRTERLILGPSWYVMGHEAAPMRGDTIEAQTVLLPGSGPDRRVVISAELDGDELVLRDNESKALWRVAGTDQGKPRPSQQSVARLIMLDALIGAPAMTTEKTGGEVQDVVIERNSGQIVLLAFDPNENLLGIADEIKAVPWPVVSITSSGSVRIDALSPTLTAAEKIDEDVNVYAAPARLDRVYTVYQVEPVRLERREREEAKRSIDDGWGKDGYFTKAFADGSDVTVDGKVTSVKSMSLRKGMPEARVVTVATESGEQTVILGPEWYLKRQSVQFNNGARVSIEGRKAKIEGKEYICAHSIESDGRSLTLWESNDPVWNGR